MKEKQKVEVASIKACLKFLEDEALRGKQPFLASVIGVAVQACNDILVGQTAQDLSAFDWSDIKHPN